MRPSETSRRLPRGCTYSETDWFVLAAYWYPVALSCEVGRSPYSAQLLDERLVLFRLADGVVRAARDLCVHRGAPLSAGSIVEDRLVCAYHGFQFDGCGRCVGIPAHPGLPIPQRLQLTCFPVREAYGLIWVRLLDERPGSLPSFEEWTDPEFVQVMPNALVWDASAGRQMESFLDVSHFAFVHTETFGEGADPWVPDYEVNSTEAGFEFNYVSAVSNYPARLKHLNPDGFQWSRHFRVHLPFCAKLSIGFPGGGTLHILNAASPVSARKTKVFVPICRDFDKDAPLGEILEFNHRVFVEDRSVVELQYPEDLPLDLQEEVHIRADRASIAYRRSLGALGLGRSFTS